MLSSQTAEERRTHLGSCRSSFRRCNTTGAPRRCFPESAMDLRIPMARVRHRAQKSGRLHLDPRHRMAHHRQVRRRCGRLLRCSRNWLRIQPSVVANSRPRACGTGQRRPEPAQRSPRRSTSPAPSSHLSQQGLLGFQLHAACVKRNRRQMEYSECSYALCTCSTVPS
jgi:hypothetical protein